MSARPFPLRTHPLPADPVQLDLAPAPGHRLRPADLAGTATRLAALPDLWHPLVRFNAAERHYARLPVSEGPEAWLLTWLPGQGTSWHDHGGSAGAFVVLRGALTERQATGRGGRGLQVASSVREVTAGRVRPFGAQHVHQVTNLGAEPAVSLHVYSPALVEMHEYEVRAGRLHLTSARRAGVSW